MSGRTNYHRTTTAGRRARVLLFLVPWVLYSARETAASPADEYRSLLQTVIRVSVSQSPSGGRLTVQYAVLAICQVVDVPYQFNKSYALTEGKSALYIEPLDVKDVPAEDALRNLLVPLALDFVVDDAGLYLVKEGTPPPVEPPDDDTIIGRVGDAVILRAQPVPLPPLADMELSPAERLENFETLWEAIDQTYSFFEHKDINWVEVREQYRPKVEAVANGTEYYELLAQLIRELRDGHSWLCNYQTDAKLLPFSPPLAVREIEQQAVVTAVAAESSAWNEGLGPGAVITEVDGLSVAAKIEQLRPLLPVSSSERNAREVAYRRLLDGPMDSEATVTFLPPGGELRQAKLQRTQAPGRDWFQTEFPVVKAAYTWYGIHPSGVGYIRILSFNGRLEIADEFDLALESLKQTAALIIDIRDNPGGFGTAHSRIVGRFLSARKKVAVSYLKNGPGHQDFATLETYFDPTGSWQYHKPVALLVNSMTGSAADLFACYLISTGRPLTLGSATHGNLSGTAAFILLPCGLVVRVSNGYVCDAAGRIIEGNGNVPDIEVAPTLTDVLTGTDTVLERAVKELRARIR